MAKGNNLAESATFRVTVSVQSEDLLKQLGKRGIYGRNVAEVAGRFIDEALQRYVEQPKLSVVDVSRKKKGRTK
jgi:predicted Zn-dependent protease